MRGAHRRLDESMRHYWWWWACAALAGFGLIMISVGCVALTGHANDTPIPIVVNPSPTPPDAEWLVKHGGKCVINGQKGVDESGYIDECKFKRWRKR